MLLGLFALGSSPRVAAALLRGETFGLEATLCAAVFITSVALLLQAFVSRHFGLPDESMCR
jgi:hypothetical protein